jgi:hypothetical protein
MSIDLNKPYNPGIADIGKYAEVVAPSVSSYGHYAILTINAGTLPLSAGGQINESIPSILSMTLTANIPAVFTSSTYYQELEIQNKTSSDVFFLPVSSDMASLSADGIVIEKDALYPVNHIIKNFTIGSLSGGSVRIISYEN